MQTLAKIIDANFVVILVSMLICGYDLKIGKRFHLGMPPLKEALKIIFKGKKGK